MQSHARALRALSSVAPLQLTPSSLSVLSPQAWERLRAPASQPGCEITDALLEERVEFLCRRSPHFAQSWSHLAQHVRLRLRTREQMEHVCPHLSISLDDVPGGLFVHPTSESRERFEEGVDLVVDTTYLFDLHRLLGQRKDEFLMNLDTTLAHLVHGHARSVLIRDDYQEVVQQATGEDSAAQIFSLALQRQGEVRAQLGVSPLPQGFWDPAESKRHPDHAFIPYHPESAVDLSLEDVRAVSAQVERTRLVSTTLDATPQEARRTQAG